MKKALTVLGCLLIVAGSFAQEKNFIDCPYVEANGEADSLVTPNEIFIRIVISEKDTRDKVPLEETETKMITALKGMGIDIEKDLTVSDMLSNYRFYLLKQKDILKSKEYMLKVTDAATASNVFIKLEDLGISNSQIDHVNHTELEAIGNICRSRAILNAKTRAQALVTPLHQSVGTVLYVADQNMPNYSQQLEGRLAGVVVTGYGGYNKYKAEEPPKINFKKIKVNAQVQVKFRIDGR